MEAKQQKQKSEVSFSCLEISVLVAASALFHITPGRLLRAFFFSSANSFLAQQMSNVFVTQNCTSPLVVWPIACSSRRNKITGDLAACQWI